MNTKRFSDAVATAFGVPVEIVVARHSKPGRLPGTTDSTRLARAAYAHVLNRAGMGLPELAQELGCTTLAVTSRAMTWNGLGRMGEIMLAEIDKALADQNTP